MARELPELLLEHRMRDISRDRHDDVLGTIVLAEEAQKISAPHTPNAVLSTKDLATKQGLAFPIVHDDGLKISQAFGLAFTLPDDLKAVYQSFGIDLPKNTGHALWELPMPARFVIDHTGIIRTADVDPDYAVRPEAEATLAALRSIA